MAVASYTFMSEVLGEQTRVMIVLPAFEPWRAHEGGKAFYESYGKKKVVYVLHGGSDDSTMYLRRTGLEEYVTERDMIAVCPEVRLSFYCNMVHGKRYFDYLSRELPEVMEHLLPISGRREDHFVIGNSMGAHGAFKWALNCPDYFAAAAGMSGAGDLEELGFYDGPNEQVLNAFGTREEYRGSMNDFHHLMSRLMREKAAGELPELYSCCGISDPFYEGSGLLAAYGQALGYPIFFEEGEGGHTWTFWDRWLPVMLDRMLEREVG